MDMMFLAAVAQQSIPEGMNRDWWILSQEIRLCQEKRKRRMSGGSIRRFLRRYE
jgi:hypothetical protein